MQNDIITNEQKRQVYATLKVKLKVALQQEFYLEALLLEYSILEDRLTSMLKHSDIRYTESNGREFGIQKKLNKVQNAIISKRIPIHGKVKPALVEEILAWKETRNNLVHKSCQRLYNSDEVKKCALDGNELVRRVTNAASSIKHAAERLK